MHGSSDADPNPGNLAPSIQAGPGRHAQIVRHPTAKRRWMSHDLLLVNLRTGRPHLRLSARPTHGPARRPQM